MIIIDHPKHRVELDDQLKFWRQDINRIDHRRQPKTELQQDGNHLAYVTQEDVQDAKYQPKACCQCCSYKKEDGKPEQRPAWMVAYDQV